MGLPQGLMKFYCMQERAAGTCRHVLNSYWVRARISSVWDSSNVYEVL